MNERRAVPRFTLNEIARLEIYGDANGSYEGRIANISENGIAILLEQPAPCGDLVRVDLNDYVLIGEIRYCERTTQAYSVGVELFEFLTKAELKKLFEQILSSSAA